MMTPPSSPPLSPLSPTSPTSPSSTSTSDASPSPSAASSRRRLFGLFQKVAASPLTPGGSRTSQATSLKHVASAICWEEGATDNEDHADNEPDVDALSPEELLLAPATVLGDECLVLSLLPPVSSPPEWHQLPAHILELIIESSLLPENELTTSWKERAVS